MKLQDYDSPIGVKFKWVRFLRREQRLITAHKTVMCSVFCARFLCSQNAEGAVHDKIVHHFGQECLIFLRWNLDLSAMASCQLKLKSFDTIYPSNIEYWILTYHTKLLRTITRRADISFDFLFRNMQSNSTGPQVDLPAFSVLNRNTTALGHSLVQ